jgi:hypothetical protein
MYSRNGIIAGKPRIDGNWVVSANKDQPDVTDDTTFSTQLMPILFLVSLFVESFHRDDVNGDKRVTEHRARESTFGFASWNTAT